MMAVLLRIKLLATYLKNSAAFFLSTTLLWSMA